MTVDPVQVRSRKIGLSWTIASFLEASDPYGFRDELHTGETVQEGIARVSEETLGYLESGDYDVIVGALEGALEDGMTDDLETECQSILRELKEIRILDSKLISKNVSRIKRRR